MKSVDDVWAWIGFTRRERRLLARALLSATLEEPVKSRSLPILGDMLRRVSLTIPEGVDRKTKQKYKRSDCSRPRSGKGKL